MADIIATLLRAGPWGVVALVVMIVGMLAVKAVQTKVPLFGAGEKAALARMYSALSASAEKFNEMAELQPKVHEAVLRIESRSAEANAKLVELHEWGKPTQDGSPLVIMRRRLSRQMAEMIAPLERRLSEAEAATAQCRATCRSRNRDVTSSGWAIDRTPAPFDPDDHEDS